MTVSMGSGGSYVGLSWKDSSESSIHNVINTSACTLYAPLKSSLILSKGAGDPAYSMATSYWSDDNDLKLLRQYPAGSAFFGGARLNFNRLRTVGAPVTSSANFSDATVSGLSLAYSAGIVTATVSGASAFFRFHGGGSNFAWPDMTIGNDVYIAVKARGVGSSIGKRIYVLNQSLGDLQTPVPVTLTGDFQIVSFRRNNKLVHADYNFCMLAEAGVATVAVGETVEFKEMQINLVTGYPLSYIPEYVSVGVDSAPFPAGIDGANYYETNWQGAPIAAANLLGFRREAAATNNLLHSRVLSNGVWTHPAGSGAGSEILTNGTFGDSTGWSLGAAWAVGSGSLNMNSAAPDANADNTQTFASLVTGKQYLLEFDFTYTSGSVPFIYVRGGAVPSISASTGRKSIKVICGSSTAGYGIRISSPTTGVCSFDNMSLKEAPVQVTTCAGIDGIANTASTLTAAAADAIILQPITLASASRCASTYVRRRTGTGTVSFTQDGGSTWTPLTFTGVYGRSQITSTLANPSVGFKISTSGDAIDVDVVGNEAGTVATSPIITTTAAVTRNANSLTYQTASNWSDTAGTAYIEAQPLAWVAGGAIGSATNGLLLSAANSGATASDGTNTANGPAGSPSGRKKLAMRWGGGAMTVASGGVIGAAGTYDGGMGLASVGIAVNSSTYCGRVALYDYAMTDAELQAITS